MAKKSEHPTFKNVEYDTLNELGYFVGAEFQKRTGYNGWRISEFFGMGFEHGSKAHGGFFYGIVVERSRQDYLMGLKDRIDGHDMSQGEHRNKQGAVMFVDQYQRGWRHCDQLDSEARQWVNRVLFGDPQDIRERTKKAVMKDLTGVRA